MYLVKNMLLLHLKMHNITYGHKFNICDIIIVVIFENLESSYKSWTLQTLGIV